MPPSQALALHTVKRVSLVLDIPGPVVSARLVSRGERGRVVEVLSLVVEVLPQRLACLVGAPNRPPCGNTGCWSSRSYTMIIGEFGVHIQPKAGIQANKE